MEEKKNNETPSPSNQVSQKEDENLADRRDLKLKEAEKTIANKDVIIKMLQDHVKKLENSYKQNLKETENFRYKFCVASEQVKRLQGICPGVNKEKAKQIQELQNDVAKWKQQCNHLACSKVLSESSQCFQEVKNLENFMKSHYELLQAVAEKILEKSNEQKVPEHSEKEYTDEILKLQEELRHLKDENSKLKKQIEGDRESFDVIPLEVKDSLLETYKRTNSELQKRLSQFIEHTGVDLTSESDISPNGDASPKRISFSSEKASQGMKKDSQSSGSVKVNKERTSKVHVITEEIVSISEEIPEVYDKVSFNNEVRFPHDNTSDTSEEQIIVIKKDAPLDEEKTENLSEGRTSVVDKVFKPILVKGSAESADVSGPKDWEQFCKDLNEMHEKLNDIRGKVDELTEQQNNTRKDLEFLKTELSDTRDTTKESAGNVAKLSQNLDEQKDMLLGALQAQKVVTDNLINANNDTEEKINVLQIQVDRLFREIDELKKRMGAVRKESSQSDQDDLITMEECKEVIGTVFKFDEGTIQSLGLPTQNFATSPGASCRVREQKEDQPAEGLQALEKNYDDLKNINKEKDKKIECINNLIAYYQEARRNILALQPEVAAGLQKQVDKECSCANDDINKCIDKLRDENLKLKTTISKVIDKISKMKMQESKVGLQCEECSLEICYDNKNSDLEIEDIYKAVRNTILPQSSLTSSSCCCNSSNVLVQGSQSDENEENYVLCTCVNRNSFQRDPTEQAGSVRKKCGAICSGTESCASKTDPNCRNENLMTNLETYVGYLHEQLNIISSIENRIEDLRGTIKDP